MGTRHWKLTTEKNPLMKAISFFLIFFFSVQLITAQSPIGTWKTIDDVTGEAKSHVKIFEKSGKYHCEITKLLQRPADTLCDQCPGDKKNKLVLGLEIMWGLKPYKDYWSYGEILDPENGKTYKCSIWLEGDDILKVRGYIGISALGRTQTWHRVK